MRPLPRSVLAVAVVLASSAAPALGATVSRYDPSVATTATARVDATDPATAPRPGRTARTPTGALRRAPADAPASQDAQPTEHDDDQGNVDTGDAGSDPLVGNGLGGAMCRNARLASGLSASARRNCQTAGTASASAPIGHYGFDVHIDTGALGLSSRTLQAALQTLLLTPLWTLLVWLTHAALSLLEWSFAIDLLDPATMGSVARSLQATRATVTEPWLVVLLALAAIALLYYGIVRRRVADSIGAVAAMTAMIIAGLWIIANPAGTIGEVNRAINQTGLGAVAVVSSGNVESGNGAFGDGLRAVFATAIEGPWCYMEFGDVDWCRNPRRLDASLADTARGLRRELIDDARCDAGSADCSAADESRRQATLLADARTNGELFLAFPTNSAHRNAINDVDSLFRALCNNDEDNHCRGEGAPAAQWRTESGTWARAGGLMLITVGSIGMLALIVFIALRLLGAAILTVVYLLLAPVAVLAPTVGESGRAAFRGWAVRLIGALLAKLIYALFLGVVLLTLSIFNGMSSLGWWTQWLLIAAFWWIVFTHRHEVLAYARLGHTDTGERGLRLVGGLLAARQIARTASDAATPARRVTARAARTGARAARATHTRLRDDRVHAREQRESQTLTTESNRRRDQVERSLGVELSAARRQTAQGTSIEAEITHLDGRRQRIGQEIVAARAAGDTRRAARLADRDARLRRHVVSQRSALERAETLLQRTGEHRHDTGGPYEARDLDDQARLLDREAAKRRGVAPGPRANADAYRDYARLASLADLSSERYLTLPPAQQRRARLTIDRELEARRTERTASSEWPAASSTSDIDGQGSERGARRIGRRAPESPSQRRRRQLAAGRTHGQR
ncbi:MAG: hypothetical protein V7607_3489 [Solirubrobacteraceae bacterium]